MRVDLVTIFPEMFEAVLGTSILKRACRSGALTVQVHDLRQWSPDRRHWKVDDRPYGGGPGMVMRPEPFFAAVEAIAQQRVDTHNQQPATSNQPRVVLLSPQGQRLTQAVADRLSRQSWLILLCGHYEGVDERVRQALAHEELSIGDYVLTGGELPAMVVLDAVARLVPGVLGDAASSRDDSFTGGRLEYPQYTRPRDYRGMTVPEVLLSGDSRAITVWRELAAWQRTRQQRPDLVGGCRGQSP